MRISERVRSAIDAGWRPYCAGAVAVSHMRYQPDERQGDYHNLTVRAGEREIQVGISPTGRSVRVFVDGQEVP